MFKWMLTKQFRNEANELYPVCSAYAGQCLVPAFNSDDSGWCLCLCYTSAHQIEAAKYDPRVQIFRTKEAKVTPEVVETYAHMGAEAGMTIGQLLEAISEHEPLYMLEKTLGPHGHTT